MTDDKLMAVARAAGYAMIPPQDVCDADAETHAAPPAHDAASAFRATVAKLRTWSPSAPAGAHVTAVRGAVAHWFHSRAPA